MHGGSRRGLVLATVVLSLVLIGVGQGCGDGESASSSSTTIGVATSGVADTTTTTVPTTSTTEAPTTTAAPTTTTQAPNPATRPTGPPTLADVEGYRQWLKMNAEPIQGRTHGLTDIYVDQELQAIAPDGTLAFPFPDGTRIVKEQLEGSLVAIMRKIEGIDPEHGDWQWIEYRTDGSIAGQDAFCWGCHVQAESTDWVFTELETP